MKDIQPFIDEYVKVLKNYTLFEGRARRNEFWKFILVNFVILVVLSMVADPLAGLYNLAVLIPSLAVGSRRLHDIGKSGWWQLIGLIPIIGWIIIIIFFATDTELKDNQYGPNTKAGTPHPPVAPTPTGTS